MVAPIVTKAEQVEQEIQELLAKGKRKYKLVGLENDTVIVPTMIMMFSRQGWVVSHDCPENDGPEWLEFKQKKNVNDDDWTGYD